MIAVVLILVGALFTAIPFFMTHAWWEQRSWTAVPCEITHVEVQQHGESRRVDVRFTYTWDGQTYTGGMLSTSGSHPGGLGPNTTAEQIAAKSRRTCYVNPEKPFEAVLYREQLHLVASLAGLALGLSMALLSLTALLQATKDTAFEAALGRLSVRAAVSSLSMFIIAAGFLYESIQLWREPEPFAFAGGNPLFLEILALVFTTGCLSERRVLARSLAGLYVLIACCVAAFVSGEVLPLLAFAVFRIWPMLRRRPRYPAFQAVNFCFTIIIMIAALELLYGHEYVVEPGEADPAAWLLPAWACLYYALFGVFELFAQDAKEAEE